jgi:hypothetical protein
MAGQEIRRAGADDAAADDYGARHGPTLTRGWPIRNPSAWR